ncbi:MAG: hypothetical protein M0P73_06025 [Syntrophobacterales bacterium]|jgi:hypothetical protein|nr:hypothetical protein [Syntrophobacterales bacterium]
MLPIYLKDQEFSPPDDPIYYLLTRDGLFLVKRTLFFEAVVPAAGIPWLEPQEPRVNLSAPPLPAALLLQALACFRAVYNRYRSEAVVLLGWREATRTYELVLPHQTVGGGHCDYEIKEFPAGLTRLGTIHSHAGVEAFHSLRDWEDERFEDGLHLTIGNLDTELTLSCSVVVQGFRAQIPPERLFSPYPIPWDQAPPESDWAAEVERKVTPLPPPIEFGP